MIRVLVLVASLFTLSASLFSADAQRVRREEFDQKMLQLQQADMDGRAATAEVGARITDLNATNAELNGKVETLEFLLSQSRDQVNQMQADDAEIAKLISRLESRLAAQDKKISDLEGQLAGVQSTVRNYASIAPIQSSDASGDGADTTAGTTTVTRRTVTTQPTTDGTTRTVTTTGQPTRITRTTEPASTSGPTRITRTVNADEAGTLPQGTLGELPASNLPGEAGPLFAEAKSRLLRFDYEGAEMAFETFLSQFGDDPQAGEAQYWLAEALYQQEAYAESGQAYTEMIRTYPDDPRAPEALAKLARAMRLVGDTDRACNALDLLPQQYPNASGLTQNLARGERVRSGCDS